MSLRQGEEGLAALLHDEARCFCGHCEKVNRDLERAFEKGEEAQRRLPLVLQLLEALDQRVWDFSRRHGLEWHYLDGCRRADRWHEALEAALARLRRAAP